MGKEKIGKFSVCKTDAKNDCEAVSGCTGIAGIVLADGCSVIEGEWIGKCKFFVDCDVEGAGIVSEILGEVVITDLGVKTLPLGELTDAVVLTGGMQLEKFFFKKLSFLNVSFFKVKFL